MNLAQTVTWIPVTERLPETSKNVMAAIERGAVISSRYSSNLQGFLSPNGESLPFGTVVTHWAEPLVHPSNLPSELPSGNVIHLKFIMAVSGDIIEPGTGVILLDGKAFAVGVNGPIGVSDPFLKSYINEGEEFRIFLNPEETPSC